MSGIIESKAEFPKNTYGLTEREISVLQLMAMGLNNKMIGAELAISYRTIELHVSNIINKMLTPKDKVVSDCRCRAVWLAYQQGLIEV